MTQPSSQKPTASQFSLQMQRKMNQQADTRRVNRLQARGGEMNSQGIFLPINEAAGLSFNQLDFSTHQQASGSASQHQIGTNQQTAAAQKRDRFAPHPHHQISAVQKKELAIMN